MDESFDSCKKKKNYTINTRPILNGMFTLVYPNNSQWLEIPNHFKNIFIQKKFNHNSLLTIRDWCMIHI